MRQRYAVAAGFVVVVAALILIRDEGYLGGRTDGGPLVFAIDADGSFSYELDGDAVSVQDVRFRVISPGMRFRGPALEDGAELEGARLSVPVGEGRVRLRAREPGVYYLLGGTVDYRRGQRRFRARFGDACITVKVALECDSYRGPADAAVAEIGGPSRYRGAEFEGRTAVFGATRIDVRLTIANRTRAPVEVSDLRPDFLEDFVFTPSSFRLGSLGQRSVRVRLRGCEPVDDLRALLDGEDARIPLSVPLDLRC